MAYQIQEQYVDLESGFHVITLGNEHGHKHIIQIAIGADACPACGRMHTKELDALDPKAMVAEVADSLNRSHDSMREYGRKHGIQIR